MSYDESYVLKTIDECDLSNRPNYKKLFRHIKENEHHLVGSNRDEMLNYEDELLAKKNELNTLKRRAQEETKKLGSLSKYKEFIDKVQVQQAESRSSDGNVWEQINSDMEKELKRLDMIQAFLKKNKQNEKDEIEIDEEALVKANDILKHFCEQN